MLSHRHEVYIFNGTESRVMGLKFSELSVLTFL